MLAQVVNDDARTQGGIEHAGLRGLARGKKRWTRRASKVAQQARRVAALTAGLAAQSEKEVADVCNHPRDMQDESAAEHNVAPPVTENLFVALENHSRASQGILAPRPREARARSTA